MRHSNVGRAMQESVYFYTFHKCASTLFSGHVLGNVRDLRHRDFARLIYDGNLREPVAFEERGYVYGPIRLSLRPGGPVHEQLVSRAADADFVRDRICVFLARDPRDILVSRYHSLGFTHGLSPVGGIRRRQETARTEIRRMTLDEYALSQAEAQRRDFALMHELHAACSRSVLLRYEDLVDDFDRFARDLCRYLPLPARTLRKIERSSRPRRRVDASRQRRSGRPGQFREALRAETVESLNGRLGGTLQLFGYAI